MSERAQGQPDELLERDAELDSLRAGAEAGARGDGRVLVLEGPAGIGKTALVEAGCARAREAGLEPLVARGGGAREHLRVLTIDEGAGACSPSRRPPGSSTR